MSLRKNAQHPAPEHSLLRYRLIRPGDLPALIELSKESPYSYGLTRDSERLLRVLPSLIAEQVVNGVVVEESLDRAPQQKFAIGAFGLTAFLEPHWLDTWLADPPQDLASAVVELEAKGERPLLRVRDIARENALGQLNLLFLAYGAPEGDPTNAKVRKLIGLSQEAFRFSHAGYACSRALHPVIGGSGGIGSLLAMGFRPVGAGSEIMVHDLTDTDRVPFHPLVMLRRTDPPILGFTPAEQSTLARALLGSTDAEIAHELAVSVETIRKRWRAIFERVSDRELLADPALADAPLIRLSRGPEKRRLVLQYLATHLEELRPYARPRDAHLPK